MRCVLLLTCGRSVRITGISSQKPLSKDICNVENCRISSLGSLNTFETFLLMAYLMRKSKSNMHRCSIGGTHDACHDYLCIATRQPASTERFLGGASEWRCRCHPGNHYPQGTFYYRASLCCGLLGDHWLIEAVSCSTRPTEELGTAAVSPLLLITSQREVRAQRKSWFRNRFRMLHQWAPKGQNRHEHLFTTRTFVSL